MPRPALLPLSQIQESDAKAPRGAAGELLLVDAREAAAMCGISPASWHRYKAAGKTPAPVLLGGRVLYRLEDLRLWVDLGCPDREEFEARKAV
jgi:hypothetical protein